MEVTLTQGKNYRGCLPPRFSLIFQGMIILRTWLWPVTTISCQSHLKSENYFIKNGSTGSISWRRCLELMMCRGPISIPLMAGWHHRLDGRESEWTLGVGDGQGGLACWDSWGRKESDTTEQLNWTELNWMPIQSVKAISFGLWKLLKQYGWWMIKRD